jgi:geranylgeranyl reductase family protein
MHDHFDVIVIGGGPAGSSAARTAAQLNARVLLLERHVMPRPKLCGGWVTNRALKALDFELPSDLVECHFDRAELRYQDTGADFAPSEPIGIFVSRASFDHHLERRAREAGVTVRYESANAISEEGARFVVHLGSGQITADGVILCCGANSNLIRAVREPDTPRQSAICMEQNLPVDLADQFDLQPGTARLYFGLVPYGYGWLLHHGEYLVTGIGCRRSHCADLRGLYDAFWSQLSPPRSLQAPKGHPIPLGGFSRRLGRGRLLSAGDAAGMVDAFSGEGIAFAIRSGQLAAKALADATNAGAAATYLQSCRTEILQHLRMSLWAARAYHSAPRLFLRSFCSNHAVLSQYNEVLDGNQDYKQFILNALKTRLAAVAG